MPPLMVVSGPPPRRRLVGLTCFTLSLILVISVGALRSSTGTRTNRYLKKSKFFQQSVDTDPGTVPSTRTRRPQEREAEGRGRLTGEVGESEQVVSMDHVGGHAPSLTRLGSQLTYDLTTCPPGSKMLQKDWQDVIVPRTSLCPRLFIIGAKKGGTTSLYNYLSQHPDFQGIRLNVSTMIGETAYFAQRYKAFPLAKYLSMFPRDKMSGDASVDNLVHCRVPQRILKTCGGKVKVVVLLRDPVERYVSNFMMRVARKEYGRYTNYSSIAESTQQELEVLKNAAWKKGVTFPANPTYWSNLRCLFGCCDSMIYEGLYYVFLMNWLCNFPADSLMVINSEELFRNPTLILQQVIEFLDLKPLDSGALEQITSQVYNRGVKPHLPQHQLSMHYRKQLDAIYGPFNTAVLKMLQWQDHVRW